MYKFSRNFSDNLYKNTGIVATEDTLSEILANCNLIDPFTKVDNKGRSSEYFTFRLQNKLITVVAFHTTKVIVTAVIETHNRKVFMRGR